MSHSFDDKYLSNAKFYMLFAFGIALLGLGVIQLTPFEGAGRLIVISAVGPVLMFLYQMLKVFMPGRESKNSDTESNKEP